MKIISKELPSFLVGLAAAFAAAGLGPLFFSCKEGADSVDYIQETCSSIWDCPYGYLCDTGTGECVENTQGIKQCLGHEDCDGDDLCVNGMCMQKPCSEKEPCPSEYIRGALFFCNPETNTCVTPKCSGLESSCKDDEYCSWETLTCKPGCEVTGCIMGKWCDSYSKQCLDPDPKEYCSLLPDNYGKRVELYLALPGGRERRIYLEQEFSPESVVYWEELAPNKRKLPGVLTRFERATSSKGGDMAEFELESNGRRILWGRVPFDWDNQQPPEVGRLVVAWIEPDANDPRERALPRFSIYAPAEYPIYRTGLSDWTSKIDPGFRLPLFPKPLEHTLVGVGCQRRKKYPWWQAAGALAVGLQVDPTDNATIIEPGQTRDVDAGVAAFSIHNVFSWGTGDDPRFGTVVRGLYGLVGAYMTIKDPECYRDSDCPRENPRCEMGRCVPGCEVTGCTGHRECDPGTGLCEYGECRDMLSHHCNFPYGYCNRDTKRCERTCIDVGCPDEGDICDPGTGRCRKPGEKEICYTGGNGEWLIEVTNRLMPSADEDSVEWSGKVLDVSREKTGGALDYLVVEYKPDAIHYDTEIKVPLPLDNAGFMSRGDSVDLQIVKSFAGFNDSQYNDNYWRRQRVSVVFRDEAGRLLYATGFTRDGEWQDVVPELEVESRSMDCPWVDRGDYYTEVKKTAMKLQGGDWTVLEPGSSADVEYDSRVYTLMNVDSTSCGFPDFKMCYSEQAEQYIIIRKP
ncbi:MAG: hypothetical protein GXP49_00140 [Deltaproteobacteria bacterium]|nr:hypothetical protein [Deltaproteobacteria bacterium]